MNNPEQPVEIMSERLRIFRHLSSLYQDLADTGELTAEEIKENIVDGDELADLIISSLSMKIVGTEGDAIVVLVKPLEDTWEFLEAYDNSVSEATKAIGMSDKAES